MRFVRRQIIAADPYIELRSNAVPLQDQAGRFALTPGPESERVPGAAQVIQQAMHAVEGLDKPPVGQVEIRQALHRLGHFALIGDQFPQHAVGRTAEMGGNFLRGQLPAVRAQGMGKGPQDQRHAVHQRTVEVEDDGAGLGRAAHGAIRVSRPASGGCNGSLK